MKTKTSLLLAALVCSLSVSCSFLNSGCASIGGAGSSLGPIIAEVAQARIAKSLLDRNPAAETKLRAIATALDVISAEASGAEISELAIRSFVANRAAEWQLTAPEQELLTIGLLAARNRFLQSTGAGTILTNDPRVGVWISALKRGIDAGIAAHRAQSG